MNLRLLVADDNDMQIESILTFVDWEQYGFTEIMIATDGEECLDIDQWFKPHVIITDIEMPKLDAMALIKKLRDNQRDVKIIIISCHEKFEYARKAVAYDVRAYILKPIKPDEMCCEVEKVIAEINQENKLGKMLNENLKLYGINSGIDEAGMQEVNSKFDIMVTKNEIINVIDDEQSITAFIKKYFDDYSRYSVNNMHICCFIINALELALMEKGMHLKGIFSDDVSILNELVQFDAVENLGNWVSDFLSLIIKHLNSKSVKTNKYTNLVKDIKDIINKEFCSIDSVEQVADKLGISASYAKKIFHVYTGTTIFEYLYIKRMEAAKVLLDDPYDKIYEIAEKLGYKSKNYFAETFRKYSGYTPSEYRKR